MPKLFNLYCDESCHLENDLYNVMVLGSVWCETEKVSSINIDMRSIKTKHQLNINFETKWVKVSPGKIHYYLDVIKYFFNCDALHFRALVIPDKSILNHSEHQQTQDDFYYKMYFEMLKAIISPRDRYRIYLDIKDTRGGEKIRKLHDVLCNNIYDFPHEIIERIQIVRSSEIEILQICDLLIGALGAINREITKSPAKLEIISLIRKLSGYDLKRTTLLRESKFNLLIWHPSEID